MRLEEDALFELQGLAQRRQECYRWLALAHASCGAWREAYTAAEKVPADTEILLSEQLKLSTRVFSSFLSRWSKNSSS